MGVKLFSNDLFKYNGYELGNHVFEDLRDGTKVSTPQAKYHISGTAITMFCKNNGEIDSTYYTQRTVDKNAITKVIQLMLKSSNSREEV